MRMRNRASEKEREGGRKREIAGGGSGAGIERGTGEGKCGRKCAREARKGNRVKAFRRY